MRTALPIMVAVGLALSTAACQNMPWSHDKSTGGTQTGSAAGTSGAASASAENQAVASDMVRDIQRRLSQRGYDAGPADGVYGESTQTALKNFQKDQNIRSTGQIDEQTLAALGVGRAAGAGAQRSEAPSSDYQPMNRRAR